MNRPSPLLSQTQPLPQSKRSPWGTVRWIAVMLLAAGGIAGAGWWGVQLMVNPQTLLWMNRWFPDWIPISVTGLKPPQTMTQIRRELEQAGLTAGEPLPLDKNTSFLDQKSSVDEMLLPILKSSTPCQGTCDRIVELRLYQSTLARRNAQREPYFQQVSALPIVGPDDAFVVAPIVDARSGNQGSTRALPLTMLRRFEGTVPSEGVWLNLSGRTVRGDTTIAYGRVLNYNPRRFHLSTPLDWTSPVGKDPVWQELTGQGQPELLIDQTVGMEPLFKVYRVTTINFAPNPTQLEPISLLESALNLPAYDTALLLARSGLWSPSEQWLQSLKRRGKWSAQAQAQLDVIHLHATATQAQAEKSWSSPGQQVLANLMDGRWARALTVFAASAETGQETAAMLKGASDRVQNRIETALAVNPGSADVKAWMALLITSQQTSSNAIAWLKQQPKTTAAERAKIASLLARLETPIADADPSINAPAGRVIGSGRLLPTLNPAEWLTPKQAPPLKLEDQQAWYTVQVTGFHDGKRWRFGNLPAATSADAVWQQLGFTADPPLQIVFWTSDGQEQTVYASIKAVRRSSSGLQLLAVGDAIAPSSSELRPLAFTDSALEWLTPSTTTLSELAQQQTAWAARAIPALAAELKRSGKLPAKKSAWDALNQVGAGDWSVQQVPLTGSQPDAVLTVYPTSRSPRTLIFSPTGTLLYSELSTEADHRILAIADLGDGPVLMADGPSGYRSLRWFTTRKRFE